jgi:hypothetical protein
MTQEEMTSAIGERGPSEESLTNKCNQTVILCVCYASVTKCSYKKLKIKHIFWITQISAQKSVFSSTFFGTFCYRVMFTFLKSE